MTNSPRANNDFALYALLALNFFMADMQAGIGPFLAIYLQSNGWKSGRIGTVMTIGGIAGMLMTAPAGAWIDSTRRKRMYVVIPGIFAVAATWVLLLSKNFWVVAASQVATAVSAAAIAPAVAGITLGLVFQQGFNRQNGRNQAVNHSGNVVGAGLSGFLGLKFGFTAVFLLAAIFGLFSIISVLLIPSRQIDDEAARGLEDKSSGGQAIGFAVLFRSRPLLILAASLACFHLGNGALLPMYGLAVVGKLKQTGGQNSGTGLVAMTIVIAQATMILMSLLAMRFCEKNGYWLVLLISFLSLPVRGLVAAKCIASWGIYPVQILDGVGAGLQSVAGPGLVACLLNGTGRVNVGQGALMTVQGLGAAMSPMIGGWLAQEFGYPITFSLLGSFALVSIGLWLLYSESLKSACRIHSS